ncbi:hypothetical protein V8E53_011639 [Lactarius tabidus]
MRTTSSRNLSLRSPLCTNLRLLPLVMVTYSSTFAPYSPSYPRAITSNLSKPIQQKRTQACLRALYYIPRAIRDLLASYAAGKHFCLEILPLLNSPESLEIIDELWDTPNDDIALSVRCAAAAVAAFMITPPRHLLDNFVTPDIGFIGFIGDDDIGQDFLAERLRVGDDGDRIVTLAYSPRSDSARLQNIPRFLSDITNTLRYMKTQWWTSDEADSIRRERQSSARAEQDLITLTLEILARDPVFTAGRPQRANVTSMRMARKDHMELIVGRASALAVRFFRHTPPSRDWLDVNNAAPNCGTGHELTLFFLEFEIITFFVAVLLVNLLVQYVVTNPFTASGLLTTLEYRDGKSNYMEGLMLITLYLVIALSFFYLS